ncbi:MAG: hypothetical protein ATN31_08935 [Candidatus Epulonipiscioides saccharophilum]|nr:MAG: hypothetical protein ATN31_08935 [Epulopiscium sp. AS2M-Bin001]
MIGSIMFHYFHDNKKYLKSQGSLSAQDLENIINHSSYKIISIDEWIEKYESNSLSKDEVFLSFDDALKEQLDIACPILDRYNLKALFAINTKAILSNMDKLELYRHFRNNYFTDIDDFYNCFFNILASSPWAEIYKKSCQKINFNQYLSKYDFYSYNDRKFRYLRDKLLKDEYDTVMDLLILNSNLDPEKLHLWFTLDDIRYLTKNEHCLSLHTHTHPYNLDTLTFDNQYQELNINKTILQDITNQSIYIISYPCGRYNNDTINVLKDLNILYGFISSPSTNTSQYSIGRIDCAIVLQALK